MWKTVLAGSTALAIAGATLAYAQQGPAESRLRAALAAERAGHQPRSAMRASRLCMPGSNSPPSRRRIGRRWKAHLRDLAKQRSERFAARASADRPKDPVERLALRADVMSQRGAALKKLADAAGPLYKSLDEAQKHRFVVLARLGRAAFRRARHARCSTAGCIAVRAASARPDGPRRRSAAAIGRARDVLGRQPRRFPRDAGRLPQAAGTPGGFSFANWTGWPGAAGHPLRPLLSEPRPWRGSPQSAIRAHSSVGRAADS